MPYSNDRYYLKFFELGITLREFESKTKPGSKWARATINRFRKAEWVRYDNGRYFITKTGTKQHLNYLMGQSNGEVHTKEVPDLQGDRQVHHGQSAG